MSEEKNYEEKHINSPEPWLDCKSVWPTKAAYFAWLRGLLRKGWSRYPIKTEFMKENRKRILGKKGKEVWGAMCSECKSDKIMQEIEVDHIIDAGSLTCIEDIQPFVVRLLMCPKSNLRFICKVCHKIRNHSQKKGISLEEAAAEKRAIAIIKSKKEMEWFAEHNIQAGRNAVIRRQQMTKYFFEHPEEK